MLRYDPTHPHRQRRRRWLRFEDRILLLAIAAGLPGTLLGLSLLWTGDASSRLQWTITVAVVFLWLAFAFSARDRVVYPLQVIANLLEALREEDFSIRAGGRRDDALGEVYHEVNALGEILRSQRLGAVEATALLRKVMAEIDVALFTFDHEERLRLVNRAGERLLGRDESELLGRSSGELGLAHFLHLEPAAGILEGAFPGGAGRFGVRHSHFRAEGRPHQLLVLADLSRTLREEERLAWQRLIRVLGHELNNSLAPIKSMAATLRALIGRDQRPEDWEEDLAGGLSVIDDRAAHLARFMSSYSQLAKLPPPRLAPVPVRSLVAHVARLETRLEVAVQGGPDSMVSADRAQIEQLLINLVRNAADAASVTGGGVRVSWDERSHLLELRVEDDGPGISNPANLFVPFFTTKPGGSGIGLLLSRQIAEAHGGSVTVENRPEGRGCVARLHLPVESDVLSAISPSPG